MSTSLTLTVDSDFQFIRILKQNSTGITGSGCRGGYRIFQGGGKNLKKKTVYGISRNLPEPPPEKYNAGKGQIFF